MECREKRRGPSEVWARVESAKAQLDEVIAFLMAGQAEELTPLGIDGNIFLPQ